MGTRMQGMAREVGRRKERDGKEGERVKKEIKRRRIVRNKEKNCQKDEDEQDGERRMKGIKRRRERRNVPER